MLLSHLVVVLIVVGVLLWLINTYIPMQPTIKRILNAIVVICVVLWLLSAFGILSEFGGIRLGPWRHWH
jgi:Fe2+ transport system protein B